MQKTNRVAGRARWHRLLFIGGKVLLFVLGGVVVLGMQLLYYPLTKRPPSIQEPLPNKLPILRGPWGTLECTTLQLERPPESFPDVMPDAEPLQWSFENFSTAQIEQLLKSAELTPQEKALLLDKSRWRPLTNGWQILPPCELVRDMSQGARRKIYEVLRESSLNFYIQFPIRFDADEFEPWLNTAGLPAKFIELFRKLSFRENGAVLFCDGLLLEWLCSPEEKKLLAHALSRTPTLLVRLQITPASDMEALKRYWCPGKRGETMTPFLDALGELQGGASVSISHFFSTFARIRLYTFPDIRGNPIAHRKNCFYTAMNFFNETPNYKFIEPEFVSATLRKDYMVVTNNYTFGDVMALVGQDNHIVHMSVYIAADIVFTKNGATPLAPWVLMHYKEMLKSFEFARLKGILTYRQKVLFKPAEPITSADPSPAS